jgi:DNA polymerase III subunit epsilon
VKNLDPCGCFPTGRHYPGIAHLVRVRAVGIAPEFGAEAEWLASRIAFIDTETTGRDPDNDRLVEVGIVVGMGGTIVSRQNWLIQPGIPIPKESSDVHGITDADVKDKPRFKDVVGEIVAALEGAIPAAYNAQFDRAFLFAEVARASFSSDAPPPALRREVEWLDPLVFARELYRDEQSRALGEMAERLGIDLDQAHRAASDAEAALKVLYAFAKEPKMPKGYAALVQEQRRLARMHDEARRFWKKN